jgi:hypothetical protein
VCRCFAAKQRAVHTRARLHMSCRACGLCMLHTSARAALLSANLTPWLPYLPVAATLTPLCVFCSCFLSILLFSCLSVCPSVPACHPDASVCCVPVVCCACLYSVCPCLPAERLHPRAGGSTLTPVCSCCLLCLSLFCLPLPACRTTSPQSRRLYPDTCLFLLSVVSVFILSAPACLPLCTCKTTSPQSSHPDACVWFVPVVCLSVFILSAPACLQNDFTPEQEALP